MSITLPDFSNQTLKMSVIKGVNFHMIFVSFVHSADLNKIFNVINFFFRAIFITIEF